MSCSVRGCDQPSTTIITISPPDPEVVLVEAAVCATHNLQLEIGDRWRYDSLSNEIVTDVDTLPRLKNVVTSEGGFGDAGSTPIITLELEGPNAEPITVEFEAEKDALQMLYGAATWLGAGPNTAQSGEDGTDQASSF